MNKATIGAILKNRIKECGYTQESFSEETGIALSTLKKYMSGKSVYKYDVMEILAEKLDCSYDYLMGKSMSPHEEFHSATEMTRLSEEALNKLYKYASEYDIKFEARRYIFCLNEMILRKELLNTLFDFLHASKYMQKFMESWTEMLQKNINKNEEILLMDRQLNLENQYLVQVVSELKNFKNDISPILIEELKKEHLEDEYKKAWKAFEEAMSTSKSSENI